MARSSPLSSTATGAAAGRVSVPRDAADAADAGRDGLARGDGLGEPGGRDDDVGLDEGDGGIGSQRAELGGGEVGREAVERARRSGSLSLKPWRARSASMARSGSAVASRRTTTCGAVAARRRGDGRARRRRGRRSDERGARGAASGAAHAGDPTAKAVLAHDARAAIGADRPAEAVALGELAAHRRGAGSRASSVSTPSAVTRRPRLRARSIVERTIAASLGLCAIVATNERSILISSTGSRWSCTSEEKPVPKSSMAMLDAHRAQLVGHARRAAAGRAARGSR